MHLERLAQYWDDLDDWYWLMALKLQKARRVSRAVTRAAAALAAILAGIVFALAAPPLALAAAVLMFVSLLYRVLTGPAALPGRPF